MALQFNQKSKGSLIGSGAYQVRHFGTGYSITVTCTNVTASASNPSVIVVGDTVALTFNADGENYKVPESMPTITGATGTYNRVSDTECTITLSDVTGNVSFTVEGESGYTVTISSRSDIGEYYGTGLKLNETPSSITDYDYYVSNGSTTSGTETNVNTLYLFTLDRRGAIGIYAIINDVIYDDIYTYTSPLEITLSQNTTVVLCSYNGN